MPKTAILLGASGAVGKQLLQLLINDERYNTIKLFSRSKSDITHSKIEDHVVDLFELDKYQTDFTADEVFCCIGTTKAKTPDSETYHKIDYGIPAEAAKLANKNGISTFIVVSAIGADANSSIFYNRTKGQMQNAVLKENINNTHILQPSLIVAERKETRIAEKVVQGFMWLLNPLLFGGAAKYRSIKAKTIANAMLWLANNNYPDIMLTSDEIQKVGGK